MERLSNFFKTDKTEDSNLIQEFWWALFCFVFGMFCFCCSKALSLYYLFTVFIKALLVPLRALPGLREWWWSLYSLGRLFSELGYGDFTII